MHKAVFLDKDGTLIEDVPFNVAVDRIRFAPMAFESLRELQQLGYLLIIITNQSGIALGKFEEAAIKQVEYFFEKSFRMHGILLSGFYYCPHHPNGIVREYSFECDCRKPKPGLLLKASEALDIDLERSWMVGDILNDIEAGNLAGCKTILINNGNETEWIMSEDRNPGFIASGLWEAASNIKEQENKTNG